jgi:hypothetical protein
MTEAVFNGQRMLMIARRPTPPIGGLGVKQLQWCEQHLTGFAWPRVQRLPRPAEHERAAATGVQS